MMILLQELTVNKNKQLLFEHNVWRIYIYAILIELLFSIYLKTIRKYYYTILFIIQSTVLYNAVPHFTP